MLEHWSEYQGQTACAEHDAEGIGGDGERGSVHDLPDRARNQNAVSATGHGDRHCAGLRCERADSLNITRGIHPETL